MAATLERVRISASELRDMLAARDTAESRGFVKEMKEPRQRKDNRRPDIEIYKPGLSRLRNKPKLDAPESESNYAEDSSRESVNGVSPSPVSRNHIHEENDLEHDGPLSVTPEAQDVKVTRRAKKPDRLIYQPGRRLQTPVRESVSDVTEDVVKKTEQLKLVHKDPENSDKSQKLQQEDGIRVIKNDKSKKPERENNHQIGEEMLLSKPGRDEFKSGPTKRYSDKRRTRTRTCSTSSGGSNNSSEEAIVSEERKRRQERGKSGGDRKEKTRSKKQVPLSSTDSFEDDYEWLDGPPASRSQVRKRQGTADHGYSTKADGLKRSSSRDHCKSKEEPVHRTSAKEDRTRRRGERSTYKRNSDIEKEGLREKSAEPRGRGRGILILPANTDLSVTGRTPESSITKPLPIISSKAARGRGRGGANRRLWDPNNPEQKPALKNQSPQLHFLDTDDESAASSSQNDNFQSLPQTSFYKFQNSDNPYYYGHSPYGYGGYMPYSPSPNNGIYPGTHYPGYPSQAVQYGSGSYSGSPITTEEIEQHMRTVQQQELNRLLRMADNQELQLSNLLSRNVISVDGLSKMALLRSELLQLYEHCLLTDIEFCDQHNVDQLLWKNVFYQVIEKFRHFLKEPSSESEEIRRMLLQVLDEGTIFFDGLLQKLQATYQFKLEDYMDGMAIRSKPLRKTVKFALISAQRAMICQGDIARYREQAADSCNYGKARSWYLKAQHIAPKNGRPYNQLALLAIYTRRKLDAVYYYMRSLAASNPILTAKESLMSLFEETKRKAEQMGQKQQKDLDGGYNHQGPGTTSWHITDDATRVEVWIHPATEGFHNRNGQTQDGLYNLSPSDLNKRFLLSFLHAQGKLFTRIGMETFQVVAEKLLKEFQALLQHSPSPIGSTRMLQLMAINMFSVNHSQSKDGHSGACRSAIQDQATSLGLSMFSLLVSRCIQLLNKQRAELFSSMPKAGVTEEDVEVNVSSFSSDLKELLPSVKVWSDWMLGDPSTWNPPPNPLPVCKE